MSGPRYGTWSSSLQMSSECVRAQVDLELRKYQPAPRSLLEATLRRWCELTTVLYHDKPLAGDAREAFLRESSDPRLRLFIDWAESSYFGDKHRQRRIALLQQHLSELEPYRGDPEFAICSIDEKGYASLANGTRQWLDTDMVNRRWARIVVGEGQLCVGGNVSVARLQQYLIEHPGQSIPLKRDQRTYHLLVIDDGALAATSDGLALRLQEDDLDQMHAWIMSNRHTGSGQPANGCGKFFCAELIQSNRETVRWERAGTSGKLRPI